MVVPFVAVFHPSLEILCQVVVMNVKEITSVDYQKLAFNSNVRTHALHHHVDNTLLARSEVTLLSASAHQTIWEIQTLVASQNAPATLNAPETWPVLDSSVLILARVLVD